MKKHIPNTITALNLSCGTLAVLIAIESPHILEYAVYLVLCATIFDFFDGFAARALKAYSPMGKELDSLADLISFGFAPAAILYAQMKINSNVSSIANMETLSEHPVLIAPILIVIFSALRLAKFNVDERQTSSFIGLPTPANALLLISLPLSILLSPHSFLNPIVSSNTVLFIIIIIQCFLLVSELPMFSLKVKSIKFQDNKERYFLIISAILLFIFIKVAAIPLVIVLYILTSLVLYIIKK